jgi:hypothetical protein
VQNIEFVNRAYELELICRPGAPRFVLIDGAAGYGKTYLLHRIQEKYADEHQGWKTAVVNLKRERQAASSDPDVARPCIANAIIREFAPRRSSAPEVRGGTRAEEIIEALLEFLTGLNADVLLLFDGIEELPPDTSVWLKHLVRDLHLGLQENNRELRVVFAGRYVRVWGRGAPYAVKYRSLSPFDLETVRAMVEHVAATTGRHPRTTYLAALSWWVLYLSGGHPRGICDLLQLCSARGFIFRRLKYVLLTRPFQRDGKEGTLFQLCIEPIIDDILADVEPPLRGVLAALSPIRRFDQELLVTLLGRDTASEAGYASDYELIRALRRTHLIRPPTAADPMFADQIVRRMLAVQMELQDPKRFCQINERALEVFHSWALGQGPQDPEIRRVAIIESLYHTLQLTPAGARNAETCATLEKKLDEYLAGIQNMRHVLQLRDALDQDSELTDLINRRAGTECVQALEDVIDRFSDGGHYA